MGGFVAMILPDEFEITGAWTIVDGTINKDENCRRIAHLVQNRLAKVGSDASGWDTLFRDPANDRYWELVYPQSELHGGGPPKLQMLSKFQAEQKYGLPRQS